MRAPDNGQLRWVRLLLLDGPLAFAQRVAPGRLLRLCRANIGFYDADPRIRGDTGLEGWDLARYVLRAQESAFDIRGVQ
jgi:hypothetical protein